MNRDNPTVAALGFLLVAVLLALAGGSWRPGAEAEEAEAGEARIAAFRQAIEDRVRCRGRLVEDVVAGRTDLLVAAAWFRLLDELATAGATDPPDPYADLPGGTREEKLCYGVLDRARTATLDWNPSEQAELFARLERRIAEARAQGGGRVVLPEW